jgi:hypothetical protein
MLGPSGARKLCNCKNSRCLKLYCECFASGIYCDGCNCVNCSNNPNCDDVRRAAIEATLERCARAYRTRAPRVHWQRRQRQPRPLARVGVLAEPTHRIVLLIARQAAGRARLATPHLRIRARRNPTAFRPKIAKVPPTQHAASSFLAHDEPHANGSSPAARHSRGCHCKKSGAHARRLSPCHGARALDASEQPRARRQLSRPPRRLPARGGARVARCARASRLPVAGLSACPEARWPVRLSVA